jgi:ferredoxin-type protein NapH
MINLGEHPDRLQAWRVIAQVGFFVVFALAPVVDLFRVDLVAGHAVLFGHDWRLGIDDFLARRIGAGEMAANLFLRLFLPLITAAGLFLFIAWRWGRLYCGWLCPHFAVVETINDLMRRATGKPSLWERQPLPARHPDGSPIPQGRIWWLAVLPAAIAVGFAWAVVLLTYLLPPAEVYGNLIALSPTRNQALFIAIATLVFTAEFLFARHLFCRFGCAVGVFQSLLWMANRKAMVVGFERSRAAHCADCYAADGPDHAVCEGVCPMRLRPRLAKRKMFTCTQCGQCLTACATVEGQRGRAPLLKWVAGEAAQQGEAPVSLTGRREGDH